MAGEKKMSLARKIRGPRGHEFDVLGPAAPIRLDPSPTIPAEGIGDLLVVKQGELFVCSGRDGDMRPGFATGEGLYSNDTRYLSELKLTLGGQRPVLLSSSGGRAYEAFADLTNVAVDRGPTPLLQMTLHIRRVRLAADRLYERVEIHNHGRDRARSEVAIAFGADFADMFEVRGAQMRRSRGKALAPKSTGNEIRFAYVGLDELFRETIIEMNLAPAAINVSETYAEARWPLSLDPWESMLIEFTVEPSLQGKRARRRSFPTAEFKVAASTREWFESCTAIKGLQIPFDRVINAGMRDLNALTTPVDGGEVIAAGIPWYVAPFGRDSLLTSLEILLLKPEPARQTLLYLAKKQAKVDDPSRDAEPGKILHELRAGELARGGFVPYTPYYGSVDSTPLFIMLAASYWRWTSDLHTMHRLRPSLDAALRWIDDYGDRDGDGFVEYIRRSPTGLENQGWKDSHDSVVHEDGSKAEGPIALVEVQGYVYLAKTRIADVYEAYGDIERAATLRIEAEHLKKAFNEAFWMPGEGTFALALDGKKSQVKSVTSNPGHCLYCNIVDKDKADAVARRLMAEDMFSGWGIRTLSSNSPAYNPMSYHNGSIWPHDNAIIAAGLKRYEFFNETERIAAALFDAALESRDARLPELFCGFNRRQNVPYVAYPVACSPQAWAAAVPFMILQSMLGISARAPDGLLTIHSPHLPDWMGHVKLGAIRVGDSRVSVAFNSEEGTTSFAMLGRTGDVGVMILE
jgi:glycogen debranching enzyme